jgi:hypothetical protein
VTLPAKIWERTYVYQFQLSQYKPCIQAWGQVQYSTGTGQVQYRYRYRYSTGTVQYSTGTVQYRYRYMTGTVQVQVQDRYSTVQYSTVQVQYSINPVPKKQYCTNFSILFLTNFQRVNTKYMAQIIPNILYFCLSKLHSHVTLHASKHLTGTENCSQ